MERAFEKSGADDPEVVVRAVLAALSGRGAKLRAVVGKNTGVFVLMSRLPIRLRDRLINGCDCGRAVMMEVPPARRHS